MRIILKFFAVLLFAVLLAACLYCYARYIEPNLLALTEYEAQAENGAEPCDIVFFSDTHFGELYDLKNLEKIVRKINEQDADIVIFGGDFFDNYARDSSLLDLEYAGEQLAKVEAKHGKFAVYGNHDYGGGAVRIYEGVMESGGFDVLNDESRFVEGCNLRVVGFDDLLMGHTEKELYSLKSEGFNLVVSHEPDVADSVTLPESGVMLSGHSHGGQITLPYITERIVPVGSKKYIRGEYESLGQSRNITLFVSVGIGTTQLPYRFLTVPEIVTLRLR